MQDKVCTVPCLLLASKKNVPAWRRHCSPSSSVSRPFCPPPHSKPPARPLTDPFFNRTQPRAVPQVVVPALDKALANKKVAKFMLKE